MSDTPVNASPRPGRLPSRADLEKMRAIAERVACAGMRGIHNTDAAFARLLTGWEHGLGPATALNNIYNQDGRLALPELIKVAAVRQAGIGDVRTVEVTARQAVVEVTRADWPTSAKPIRVAYTIEDAVAAGLVKLDSQGRNVSSKDNWRKYAPDMLLARARAVAIRRYLEEAFTGLPYSADELGADTDDDGLPIDLGSSLGSTPTQDPPSPPPEASTARPTVPPDTADQEAPPPAGPPVELAERIKAVLARMGITPLEWTGIKSRWSVAGHPLTRDQFCEVLTWLDALQTLRQLRTMVNLSDASWQAALRKRGCQTDLGLSLADVQQITERLAEKATPFDRAKLGLEAAAPGNPLTPGQAQAA